MKLECRQLGEIYVDTTTLYQEYHDGIMKLLDIEECESFEELKKMVEKAENRPAKTLLEKMKDILSDFSVLNNIMIEINNDEILNKYIRKEE